MSLLDVSFTCLTSKTAACVHNGAMTYGMNPPMRRPSRALMAKKPARFDRKACEPATIDHPHIINGIQTSAPSFLLIRPLGSSAERKLTRKICIGSARSRDGQRSWGVAHGLSVVEVIGVH